MDEEEPEFEMEDVPDNLDPTSILLEVANQIELLKDSLIPLKERDEELKTVIMKLGQSGG